jgi:hypothetical protein
MRNTTDPFVRRTAAAQKTLDTWSKRALKLGTSDCVRMIAAHLRLLGYKVKLPPSGSYRSYASALKAMKAAGFASIDEALDAMGLVRIAPAAATVGDIVKLPADHPLGCFTVAVGNGRVVGYHEDVKAAATLQPVEYAGAWRVEPR